MMIHFECECAMQICKTKITFFPLVVVSVVGSVLFLFSASTHICLHYYAFSGFLNSVLLVFLILICIIHTHIIQISTFCFVFNGFTAFTNLIYFHFTIGFSLKSFSTWFKVDKLCFFFLLLFPFGCFVCCTSLSWCTGCSFTPILN